MLRLAFGGLVVLIMVLAAPAQTFSAYIRGQVQSGAAPLPGVAITVTDPASGKKYLTSTDADGKFAVHVGHPGDYTVSADMAEFAPSESTVHVAATGAPAPLALHLEFADLATKAAASPLHAAPTAPAPATRTERARNRAGANANAGFQQAPLTADLGASATDLGEPADVGAPNAVAGMGTDTATESVAVSGNFNNDNRALGNGDLQQQLQLLGLGPNGAFGVPTPGAGGAGATPGAGLANMAAGGRGGFGGAGFGGGRGGGGGGGFGGGRGGFSMRTLNNRFNQPHGNLSYTLGDSALNALPYSVTGLKATSVPNSAQQRYTGTVTGPLTIPHVYNDQGRTSYTISFTGNHSANLQTETALVPTAQEIGGDFQGATQEVSGVSTPVTIVDPQTGQPFSMNTIPACTAGEPQGGCITPTAAAVLALYPVPNVPAAVNSSGKAYNYQVTDDVLTTTGQFSTRINHAFTTPTQGRRGGGGGRGGRGGRGRSLNFALTYQGGHTTTPGIFPGIEQGTSRTLGLQSQLGFNTPVAGWLENIQVTYNRSRTLTSNLYANNQNIEGQLGIAGVSTAPIDWGLPTVTLNNFQGLADTNPVFNRAQTWTVTDGLVRRVGRHNFRLGADLRFVQNDPDTDTNARGTFEFTGQYSGYDLADLELGDARETTERYGGGVFYFHQNYDDAYVQDNWQARGNLTFNYGLRWEYVSPFTEQYNRLTNLAVGPGFSSVTPVLAGVNGVSDGILNPDRSAFEPRVGLAWKAWKNMVINTGYGINLNTGGYANMATQLAYQEPFVVNATNIATTTQPLSLSDGFPAPAAGAVVNTYSVDPNYKLGYVQNWLFDVQRQVGRTWVVNLVYTGTKGTDLDQLLAPNRTPTGLLYSNVVPFYYETSGGNSIYNGGTLLVSRRLSHSVSLRSSYTYSKSIDNASSIAGGGGISEAVPQNDLDLQAERGLSSFDMRNNWITNYEWQLPYGLNHRWGDQSDLKSSILGDWQFTGTYTMQSGMPYSPTEANTPLQGLWGVNATLRPNLSGEPITLANPTYLEYFNPAAFSLQSSGYGDAGRDILIGPGQMVLNFALSKTFRIGDFQSLDLRFNGNNVLNHANWQGLVTQINSPLFGQVAGVGAMRSITFVARYRF